MTDRERLIELIRKGIDEHSASTNRQGIYRYLADHLLSNGVIVPPCKVGDKVYKITRNKVKECEVVFIGLSADERCSHFTFVERYANGTFYKSYSMGFYVIGKTVFLTKEESEKALKERSEGK